MDEIYEKFEKLFSEELNDLTVGYPFNKKRMTAIMNLVAIIYFMNNAVTDPKTAAALIELLK